MKNFLYLVVLLFPLSLHAQNEVYVQVDYMKPKEGMSTEYVEMEKNIYKAIHKERVETGEILAWQLYEVRYPRGANAEYDYVTATIFGDFTLMNDNIEEYESLVARVHQDMTLEEVEYAATSTRDLVRSEVYKMVDNIGEPGNRPSESLLVDFMKVLPAREDEYLKMESRIWKPLHQARLDAGTIRSWGVYQLLFPSGLNHPYTHATVTGFTDWTKIADSWPEDIWSTVHPNASQSDVEAAAHETRDLVSSQIWRLIDYTMADTGR